MCVVSEQGRLQVSLQHVRCIWWLVASRASGSCREFCVTGRDWIHPGRQVTDWTLPTSEVMLCHAACGAWPAHQRDAVGLHHARPPTSSPCGTSPCQTTTVITMWEGTSPCQTTTVVTTWDFTMQDHRRRHPVGLRHARPPPSSPRGTSPWQTTTVIVLWDFTMPDHRRHHHVGLHHARRPTSCSQTQESRSRNVLQVCVCVCVRIKRIYRVT